MHKNGLYRVLARPIAVLSFFLLNAAPAAAFDIEPEYQGISEDERDRLESPRDIDGEYQSTINGYTVSTRWNRLWHSSSTPHRPTVDSTIGSITNQHFMIQNRALFKTELRDGLLFRLLYFSQQDREINQTRHIFELSQRVLPWLRANIFGEMAHFKRDNDFGFALIVSPMKEWENRLYVTYHDFTRGNHNDQSDRFVGEDPLTVGTTSQWNDDSFSLRAGFRFDRSISWNVPQSGFLFGYEKRLAFADVDYPVNETETIGVRAQWDSTFKGRSPLPGGSIVNESWLTDRTLLRASYRRGTETEPRSWEMSAMYASRQWISEAGAIVFHQSWIPGLTARLRTVRREGNFDHAQIGIEVTEFRTLGDLNMTPANQKHESREGRLQTAYEFAFRGDSRLLFAFNFDLDEWTNVPTFEGGNTQFRTDF